MNDERSFYHQMWSDEVESHDSTRRFAGWILLVAIIEGLALAWLIGGMKW